MVCGGRNRVSSTILGIIASGGAAAAAGTSFESIATGVGTGSSGTITFSAIPSTFKHLQIRGVFNDSTGNNLDLTLNNDTAANYARHRLRGDGTTAGAFGQASQSKIDTDASIASSTNYVGCALIDILDYASTSKYKTVRILSGLYLDRVSIGSGLWMSTSAVTSIELKSANNFTNFTSFALYGIKEF